jgi:acyl carrier protein
MAKTVEARIKRIISKVFDVPEKEVRDDSSPDTVPNWDSVGHINLVLALEAEFGISLLPEESMEMLSVKLIRLILEERGVTETAVEK